MNRVADIQGHIASMDELQDIVGAMRSLAGMRMQEAQHALPGIRRYADSMAAAISSALILISEPSTERSAGRGRRALILCASEHGFVGGFNERLIEAAVAELRASDVLCVLGSRGAALLMERGQPGAWTWPMATRLAGIPETVDRLAAELYRYIGRGEITRVEIISCRYRSGSAPSIEHHLLLPLDSAAIRRGERLQAPLHNLEPRALLEKLAAEYLIALLTEAAVESFASENAARFSAMESANDNVAKQLSRLYEDAREARQSEITSELLDLMTGCEAFGTTEASAKG